MASVLETLRSLAGHSIYGRRLKVTHNDYLVGPKGTPFPVEDFDATTGTSAVPYGITRTLAASGTKSYTIQAIQQVGATKTLIHAGASTGTQQFTATSASIYTSSNGTTSAVVSLLSPGASVTLVADTTATWRVTSITGTSASPLVSFTTST